MSKRGPPRDGLAIVTGASSGIGLELARQLAARGHPVLAVARRGDALAALAAEAGSRGWAPVHPLAVDLTESAAAERILAKADLLGGATWLVNNAGTNSFGPFVARELPPQAAMVRLHCEVLVQLTGRVLPGMLERRRGVVLNVASIAGFMATPYMAVYGASKAFVISFTEGLSEELAGTPIGVTALCPGPVSTGIYELAAPGAARTPVAHEMTAETCARFGIEAALRGVVVAVPGARNRFDVWSAALAPRALVRRILRARGLSYLGYGPGALKLRG